MDVERKKAMRPDTIFRMASMGMSHRKHTTPGSLQS
jgi:hypothetical protein